MECSVHNPALSLLMKHLVIGQRQKAPNFSTFHWSPRGSLVSIGQHFVATRVVHLPKSTETSLITESDQSGLNHQLLQLCTARTTWSWLCGPCIAAIAGYTYNGVVMAVMSKGLTDRVNVALFTYIFLMKYIQLSLSRLRLSRITAYLEEKIWFLL